MKKLIENRIKQALENRVFPGCVVGIVDRQGKRFVWPFGQCTDEKNSKSILNDSIFDVASITKAIPTASLALKLIEENLIQLDDQAADFLPELENAYRGEIKISHLLTQTLDYGIRLSSYKDKTPEEILEIIFNLELKSKPGTKFSYSNATSVLLGIVIERVKGMKLDVLAQKYFFDPLTMKDTTFYPQKLNGERVVPTEIDAWRGRVVCGEVHDESAFRLSQKGVVGSAGLFSTVPDLLNFMQMLLYRGIFQNHQIFSDETISKMSLNWLQGLSEETGLGWELNQKFYMGKLSSSQTIGKTGFTGCSCVVDFKKNKAVVILSNYTYPHRKPNSSLIHEVRRDVADIVWESNF